MHLSPGHILNRICLRSNPNSKAPPIRSRLKAYQNILRMRASLIRRSLCLFHGNSFLNESIGHLIPSIPPHPTRLAVSNSLLYFAISND